MSDRHTEHDARAFKLFGFHNLPPQEPAAVEALRQICAVAGRGEPITPALIHNGRAAIQEADGHAQTRRRFLRLVQP